MRYFLIFILGLIPFLSPAQDSTTVCIKPSTARYYLEVEDEVYVLREKDSLNTLLTTNLGDQLLVKDRIIETYQNDSLLYLEREATFTRHISLIRENHAIETARLTRHRNIAIGAGSGAIIGSIIPGVGTLTGAAVGAGVGWVWSKFKKR